MARTLPADHQFLKQLDDLYQNGISSPFVIPSVCELVAKFIVTKLDITEKNWVSKTTLQLPRGIKKLKFRWHNNTLVGEPSDFRDMLYYFEYRKLLFGSKILDSINGSDRPEYYKVLDHSGHEKNLSFLFDEFEQIRHTISHKSVGQPKTPDFVLVSLFVMEDILMLCDYADTATMKAILALKQEVLAFSAGTIEELRHKERELISVQNELLSKMVEIHRTHKELSNKDEIIQQLLERQSKYQRAAILAQEQLRFFAYQTTSLIQNTPSLPPPTNTPNLLADSATVTIDGVQTQSLPIESDQPSSALAPQQTPLTPQTVLALTVQVAEIQRMEQSIDTMYHQCNSAVDDTIALLSKKTLTRRAVVVLPVFLFLVVVGSVVYAFGVLPPLFNDFPTTPQSEQKQIPINQPTNPIDHDFNQDKLDSLRKIYDIHNDPNGKPQQVPPSKDRREPIPKTTSPFNPNRYVYISVLTHSPSAISYLMEQIKIGDRIECAGKTVDYQDNATVNSVKALMKQGIASSESYPDPWKQMLNALQEAQINSKKNGVSLAGRGVPYAVYIVNDMNDRQMNAYSIDKFKAELAQLYSQGVTIECLVSKKSDFNLHGKLHDPNLNKLLKRVL